jgi:uncharacterized protein with NRDE domain
MCLVVIALGIAPRYPLVLAANRDERHARPTQSAAWWSEQPHVFGGRDLLAGGTWLGADRRGRIAAVTNVRDGEPRPAPRSRGELAAQFLASGEPAARYAQRLGAAAADYAAFNLLLYDGHELRYSSNRAPAVQLGTGVHALSNAPYGTQWPKTASARTGVQLLLQHAAPVEPLFELLAERSASDSLEERYRTAHFVAGPVYGTRCSTVILLDAAGTLTFTERSFDAEGRQTGEVRETFALEPRAELASGGAGR